MNLEELADNVTVGDVIRVVNYIKNYFVIPEDNKLEYIIQGLKKLKDMFGLDQTEKVDAQTLKLLDYHRCGVPDALVSEDVKDYNRWGIDHLKWYVDSYVDGLSKDDQIAIFSTMFANCSKVVDLTFERVTNGNKANLIITSASRGNGLGSQNGTLAYAYLPPKRDFTGQLESVFDLAERWIKDQRERGILLYNTANHEICCHNLGLTHSSVRTALAAPVYSAIVAELQQNDDIPRLQSLYGKPQTSQPTPPVVPVPDPKPPIPPTNNEEITIKIKGTQISIDGYRVTKIG